jgi:hypothetical protein
METFLLMLIAVGSGYVVSRLVIPSDKDKPARTPRVSRKKRK